MAGVDDASLERTVSLNFKSEMSASAASRQLTNQAVQVTFVLNNNSIEKYDKIRFNLNWIEIALFDIELTWIDIN